MEPCHGHSRIVMATAVVRGYLKDQLNKIMVKAIEKPTTDHLKALGYKLTQSVARGVYIVMRPDGHVIPNSYSTSPVDAWDLARSYIAREIAATKAKP